MYNLKTFNNNLRKQFILGVGCQKGGTTWLHNQLIKSSEVNLGFVKEYHIHDCYSIEHCKFHERRLKKLNKILSAGEIPPTDLLSLICFHNNISTYYNYFEGLYSSSEIITTVGDITPSYAGLSSKILTSIKSNLEALGFVVKVIFLMRDPVERIWSCVRMKKRITNNQVKKKISDEELISKLYKSKNYVMKTRYDQTIINLEKVFDTNMIFYSLYEDLFKKETIDRLIKFTGIDMLNKDFEVASYSHFSPKKELISEELMSDIANYYSPVYKFISSRFDVQEKWESINLLNS